MLHRRAASQVAETLADDTQLLRYDPTAAVPPLSDPNPDGYPAERLEQAVSACLEGLLGFVRGAYRSGDPVVDEYRRHRASYAVGVVLPGGPERRCRVYFGEQEPRIDWDPAGAPADIVHRIAASALLAWQAREKSYFYLRAFSRKSSTLHALGKCADKVTVEAKDPPDLLGYYLQRKAKGADMALKQRLDLQLRPYLDGR